MRSKIQFITKIPSGVSFADLHLHLKGTGKFSFKTDKLALVAAENGIGDPAWFQGHSGEKSRGDNCLGLVAAWYEAHLASGGRENQTAEYLLKVVR
jgi:hypothetical protein